MTIKTKETGRTRAGSGEDWESSYMIKKFNCREEEVQRAIEAVRNIIELAMSFLHFSLRLFPVYQEKIPFFALR